MDALAIPHSSVRPVSRAKACILPMSTIRSSGWPTCALVRGSRRDRHLGSEPGGLVHAARHILRVVDILGADAEEDRLADLAADVLERLRRQRQLEWADVDDRAAVATIELGLEEVHRRRADEAGHEHIRRVIVERLRRVELLHNPVVHHRDMAAHGQRLHLVVGDVDEGGLEPLVQLGDFGARLHAQLGVEVGERLVHQEHRRVAHDRATQRHALALAARERLGLAVEQVAD